METVNAEYVQDKLEAGGKVQVVDVLSADSFEEKHIPSSISLPLDSLEVQAETVLPDKKMEIIVYCASADCDASPKAAEKLESMGYTKVKDFAEGLQGWQEAGYGFSGKGH